MRYAEKYAWIVIIGLAVTLIGGGSYRLGLYIYQLMFP